jgi:hypothetical protein
MTEKVIIVMPRISRIFRHLLRRLGVWTKVIQPINSRIIRARINVQISQALLENPLTNAGLLAMRQTRVLINMKFTADSTVNRNCQFRVSRDDYVQ